jgi:hypothetical protein
MRKLFVMGAVLAMAASAYAAPNVTNNTQKGSLLIFPDIDVRNANTIIRLQNDGNLAIDVKCIWMDGNKNRTDFVITLTKNQAIWFEADGGDGEPYKVNRFPAVRANGWKDNQTSFLPGGEFGYGDDATSEPYGAGLLVCFAVSDDLASQVKWNHISGTATVIKYADDGDLGAYEYSAYAFFVPTGVDQAPVGPDSTQGTLNLNGVEYDSCPLYMIGQMSPEDAKRIDGVWEVNWNRLVVASCNLDLRQDWLPVYTKLHFDVWNHQEVKYTGAFECADSWHETDFSWRFGKFDSGKEAFDYYNQSSRALRYRVQGIKSDQCDVTTTAVGLVAIQSTSFEIKRSDNDDELVGTNLTAAGKFTGAIRYDPQNRFPGLPPGEVPEGGIR